MNYDRHDIFSYGRALLSSSHRQSISIGGGCMYQLLHRARGGNHALRHYASSNHGITMSQENASTYSPACIVQHMADEMIWSSIAFLLGYVMRVLPVMSTDDDSHHTHR
jgi:hypothetical protein